MEERVRLEGPGCTVWLLPILLVPAAYALFVYAHTLMSWQAMRSWPEVPAWIAKATLEESRSHDDKGVFIQAEYTYKWEGQTHQSFTVFPRGESGLTDSFVRRAHAEIAAKRGGWGPFRCYVDPSHPSRAVLYRTASLWGTLYALFMFLLLSWMGLRGILSMYTRNGYRDRLALSRQYPDEPWRWNRNWNGSVIHPEADGSLGWMLLVTLLVNIPSLPLLYVAPIEARDGHHAMLFGLVFPLLGAVLALLALLRVLHRIRYGRVVFQMAAVPGAVGGWVAGRIRIPMVLWPEADTRVTLKCVRRYTRTRPSGERGSRKVLLWKEQKTVPRASVSWDGGETLIPVAFQVPADKPPTRDADSDNVVWELSVFLPARGPDLDESFEVPVFRAGGAADGAGDEVVIAPLDAEGDPIPEGALADPAVLGARLRRAGLLVSDVSGGGVRITVPRCRRPGHALRLSMVCAVFGGIYALLLVGMVANAFYAGLIVLAIVGLPLLAFVKDVLDAWFCRTRVEVNARGIFLQEGIIGWGRVRMVPLEDFAGMEISPRQKGARVCGVIVLTRKRRRYWAANYLDWEEAEDVTKALALTVRALLFRRQHADPR